MDDVESLHQNLLAKQTEHNNELKPAREKLIKVSSPNNLVLIQYCVMSCSGDGYHFCVTSENHYCFDLLYVWQGFLDITSGRGNIVVQIIGKLDKKIICRYL